MSENRGYVYPKTGIGKPTQPRTDQASIALVLLSAAVVRIGVNCAGLLFDYYFFIGITSIVFEAISLPH
jgi:hypothetical protein